MKQDKRTVMSVLWVVIGVVLTALGIAEKLDPFWSGMGSALLLIGSLQLLRNYRLRKNSAYREKVETAITDERNQFIRSKAWAWAGYLFILISAVSVIILKVMGQELLSMACSFAVCLMLVLYWVSYYILQRKY
jgi:hypothetical protein